jgi:hypothetical protein
VETVKLSNKGQLVIPHEIRLTPLPMFPHTTVADAASLLAKRGRKGMNEAKNRASISKTLKARDASTRS